MAGGPPKGRVKNRASTGHGSLISTSFFPWAPRAKTDWVPPSNILCARSTRLTEGRNRMPGKTRHGLLIDYEYCTGCHTCEIACSQEYHWPAGMARIKRAEIVTHIPQG